MTTTSPAKVGGRSAKGRSNLPRGPTFLRAETAARSRELLGKGTSKAGSIGLTVVPLTLSGSAVVAAATVRSWPAVVALAIVLVCCLVWAALGPTVSSLEVELPRRHDRSTTSADLRASGPVAWSLAYARRQSRNPRRARLVRTSALSSSCCTCVVNGRDPRVGP